MKKIVLLLAVLWAMSSVTATAHSMKDVESDLNERERYAEFVDRQAPAFNLTDPDGKEVSLSDSEGKTVVLNFIYTRCREECPLHMNTLAQLQEKINEAGMRDEVEFITIATDTEDVASTRDNMRAYGDNFAFDHANWQFLYRDEGESAESTMGLAEEYSLVFSRVGDGAQMHGVVTHVIDATGQMRARFHGLKFEHEHFVTYVTAAAKGPDAVAPDTFWARLNAKFKSLFD